MYRLEVFYDGKLHHIAPCSTAAEVVAEIPRLLKDHDGCERIVVRYGATALFTVDCKGNTSPA
jgi:hypothetical protein